MELTLWLVCVVFQGTVKTPRFTRYLIASPSMFLRISTLNTSSTVYIVKDLVPDLTLFYKQYKSIQPYLQNDSPPEKGECIAFDCNLT